MLSAGSTVCTARGRSAGGREYGRGEVEPVAKETVRFILEEDGDDVVHVVADVGMRARLCCRGCLAIAAATDHRGALL